MNKELLKEAITDYVESYQAIHELYNTLYETMGTAPDSKFWTTIFNSIDGQSRLIAKFFGDVESDQNWLDWYVYDNDCGKKGYKVTIDKTSKKICNIDDLIWAMTGEEEK